MNNEYPLIKQFLESNGWIYTERKFIHPHDELIFWEREISEMSLDQIKTMIYGEDYAEMK